MRMKKVIHALKNTAPGILFRREYWRHRGKRELKKYSDYEYICRKYAKLGRALDLRDPKRYTEKLQWLKLFWRSESAAICSDKYEVRGYLEQRGYGYLLNDLIAVYDSVDAFDIDALPERFVIKATHGSGWNLIVKDKREVRWFWWKKIMRSWLKQNLYWFGREWNYEKQTPRIVVEKYLEDDSGELRDYKIFCFNGNAVYMQLDENRSASHKRSYFDRSGERLPIHDSQVRDVASPFRFGPLQAEMFRLAEALAQPFPSVRADFYECGGRIYFGELTFFDGSGFFSFEPDEWDYIWGEKLQLPEPNYNLALYNEIHNQNKERDSI